MKRKDRKDRKASVVGGAAKARERPRAGGASGIVDGCFGGWALGAGKGLGERLEQTTKGADAGCDEGRSAWLDVAKMRGLGSEGAHV